MVREFRDESFEDEVLKNEEPVLIDFWAPWCGPCQMVGPIVEEISNEIGDKIKVGKVNVDENPEISEKYGIMSIPTLIIFKKGEIFQQLVGVQPKEVLLAEINKALQ